MKISWFLFSTSFPNEKTPLTKVSSISLLEGGPRFFPSTLASDGASSSSLLGEPFLARFLFLGRPPFFFAVFEAAVGAGFEAFWNGVEEILKKHPSMAGTHSFWVHFNSFNLVTSCAFFSLNLKKTVEFWSFFFLKAIYLKIFCGQSSWHGGISYRLQNHLLRTKMSRANLEGRGDFKLLRRNKQVQSINLDLLRKLLRQLSRLDKISCNFIIVSYLPSFYFLHSKKLDVQWVHQRFFSIRKQKSNK